MNNCAVKEKTVGRKTAPAKKEDIFFWLKMSFGILALASAALRIALAVVERAANLTFFYHAFTQEKLEVILNIIVTLCAFAFFVLFTRQKKGLVLGIVVVALMVFYFFYNYNFSYADPVYFTFASPDKKTTVICKEETWLLGGRTTVWQKKGAFFVETLGYVMADDGYRPFTNGTYSLTWTDDRHFVISYSSGSSGDTSSQQMKSFSLK